VINLQISESINVNYSDAIQFNQEALKLAAQRTITHAIESDCIDLTLVLADDETIQALNRQFLEVDAPTDVLAFPAGDKDPDTECDYLGDVIISLERAQLQAEAGGHTVEAELQLLVVHGVLHLLGYDHADREQKAVMWNLQAKVLAEIGCPIKAPVV
jgi:probable rRNA maturation factor